MNQYIIADEAIQDLKSIADYFLENNLEAGEQFLQAFNLRCCQLASFPNMGRSYAQIRPGVRGLSLRGFIIFYQAENNNEAVKIEILRIVHGKRNLRSIF
jgi:toxin ParE1/3/4